MNVYDFDKTIFKKDSTAQFYFFCLKKDFTLTRYLFKQGFYAILFALKIIKKTAFKEKFYCFFKGIKNIDSYVTEFWNKNIDGMNEWFYSIHREDDVVVSASPEFLIIPACERLGIRCVIASRVDKRTGKYTGLNCHGKEKVVRFREVFSDAAIEEFFSDSLSDTPLAEISKKAYLVKKGGLTDWVK